MLIEIDMKIKDLQRRKGIIRIPKEVFESLELHEYYLVFKDIVIQHAEIDHEFQGDIMTFYCISEHFKESIEGSRIMEYTVTINREINKSWINEVKQCQDQKYLK